MVKGIALTRYVSMDHSLLLLTYYAFTYYAFAYKLTFIFLLFQALGVETEDDIHSLANYFLTLRDKSRPGTEHTEHTEGQEVR